MKSIYIKAQSGRNKLTAILLGCVGILIGLIWLAIAEQVFWPSLVVLFSLSCFALLIGGLKMTEPDNSFELCQSGIIFYHRKGRWQLAWDNLVRAGVPKLSLGLLPEPLPFVAFKIADYAAFIEQISPRLMSHILIEQRSLLLLVARHSDCADGACEDALMFESARFETPDGKVLKGMQAMFANRMAQMRQTLGYDLFVSNDCLDRDEHQFVDFTNSYRTQVENEKNAQAQLGAS